MILLPGVNWQHLETFVFVKKGERGGPQHLEGRGCRQSMGQPGSTEVSGPECQQSPIPAKLSLLQMRKLRPREGQGQNHTVSQIESELESPGLPTSHSSLQLPRLLRLTQRQVASWPGRGTQDPEI